jgi:hypothetical protein
MSSEIREDPPICDPRAACRGLQRLLFVRDSDNRLIEPDLATRDIDAWAALVDEWTWIVTGDGRPPARETINDRIAALDLALVRVRQEIARGRAGHDVYRQAHLVQALHWHLVHVTDGEPQVHFIARVNHRMRQGQGARYCNRCDRWIGGKLPNACIHVDCGHPERIAA